jgi:hypothetical protein
LYKRQYSLLLGSLLSPPDGIGIGDRWLLLVGLRRSWELLVIVCVHLADAQGGVIGVQQALGPGLGIGIGDSLLSVVQQFFVIGISVLVVGDSKRCNLSQGEDEIIRNQKAAPSGSLLAGTRSRLAGTRSRSRSRSRSSLLSGWPC